jgi:hypothetical protein
MKMTKKKVLLISLIGSGAVLSLSSESVYEYCFSKGHCWGFFEVFDFVRPFLFILLPIFLFSVATYFLKEGVFKTWMKFTYWYLPIYVLVILLLSGMGGGGGYIVGDIFSSEFFALSLSVIYIIISLILVIDAVVRFRGSKKPKKS